MTNNNDSAIALIAAIKQAATAFKNLEIDEEVLKDQELVTDRILKLHDDRVNATLNIDVVHDLDDSIQLYIGIADVDYREHVYHAQLSNDNLETVKNELSDLVKTVATHDFKVYRKTFLGVPLGYEFEFGQPKTFKLVRKTRKF